MKNQTYRMTMLFDFYGELLTDRQKEFFDLYYNEDLSLSEIAENEGISRQGVRDVIVRAEAILTELAKQHHIEMPHDQLLVKAEAFAIRAGGRSPRVAKQFIEQCESGVQK